MALSHSIIALLAEFRTKGPELPKGRRRMLEFGEQNWFRDVAPYSIHHVIDRLFAGQPKSEALHEELDRMLAGNGDQTKFLFDLAKFYYRVTLGYDEYRAVDLNGTEVAEKYDLNLDLPIDEQFEIVTNFGTAEHVFNQYQFFRSLHDRTRPGGIMMHYFPNQGAYDHGFYNFQPTFVFDLCEANHYRIVIFAYEDGSTVPHKTTPIGDRADYVRMAVNGHLAKQSALLAVLQKPEQEQSFQAPLQGYYTQTLPPELFDAWTKLSK